MATERTPAAHKAPAEGDRSAGELIDEKIAALTDWRGGVLANIRKLMREADAKVVEEVKWRKPSSPSGVAVWSHSGIISTGEIYGGKIKLTFAKGAALPDPAHLFNASLDGNTRRRIDIRESDHIDAKTLKALIRAAIAFNTAGG